MSELEVVIGFVLVVLIAILSVIQRSILFPALLALCSLVVPDKFYVISLLILVLFQAGTLK